MLADEVADRADGRRAEGKIEAGYVAPAGHHVEARSGKAGLDLRILFEETLARYPNMTLDGRPKFVESAFLNQLKTLPVRLSP